MKGGPISGYGIITLQALEIYKKQTKKDPRKAWEEAAGWKDKPCPRGVFLTLCAEGFIKGIPAGPYATDVRENREHTLAILEVLDFDKTDFRYKKTVYDRLNFPAKPPTHNGHIDVIHAVYEKDLLDMSKLT
jgi:hypothetical protein